MIFLTMIAAAVSCRKAKESVQQKLVEPWPIAAIWAWGDTMTYQDSSVPSLIVYSDGRLILKKVIGGDWSHSRTPPTIVYLTKLFSAEELVSFQENVLAVVKEPPEDDTEIITCIDNSESVSFYFGTQGKGFVARVHGLSLTQPNDGGCIEVNVETTKIHDSLLQYCVTLHSLDLSGLVPWQPSFISVGFWRGEQPQEATAIWPDDWPKPEFTVEPTGADPDWSCVKLPLNQLERLIKLMGTDESPVSIQVGKIKYSANYSTKNPGSEISGWINRHPEIIEVDSFCQCCPPPAPPKFKFDLPSKVPIGNDTAPVERGRGAL